MVEIKKSKLNLGFQVCLSFTLTQHFRDEQLMISLIKYLNCGNIIRRQSENIVDFKITKFSDINNKIIPFFKEHPIKGIKAKDFEDFCKTKNI